MMRNFPVAQNPSLGLLIVNHGLSWRK